MVAGWSRALEGRLPGYGIYAGTVGLYYLACRLADLTPRGQLAATWQGPLTLALGLGGTYLLGVSLWTLVERPRPGVEILLALKGRLWTRDTLERIVGIFFLWAGLIVMADVYAAFKQAIPSLHPYTWDPFLADLDRWMHLGRPPWAWLQLLPIRDALTTALDHVYVHWFGFMAVVLALTLMAAPLTLRLRFFFGFLLLWMIGGTVLGTLMASGGPVYYADLTGDPIRFAPLLDYLDGAAPLGRNLQALLWEAYVTPGAGFSFEGISAMPSLHVAVAAYFAVWGWRVGRIWGALLTAYTAAIFIGSVALGWHYAVDGYA
ncbi:MAG: phosphatase PAP2 family protein, partial [Longimicrobiales bacterium]